MNHSPPFSPAHPARSKKSRWLPFPLLAVGFLFFITIGCTSQEAKENFDTTLCWLRPSCLPQNRSSSKPAPKSSLPTRTAPSKTTSDKRAYASSSRQKTPRRTPGDQLPGNPKCLTSASITVKASKPSVTVSYVEPTTKADGRPLTNLAKTTIYRDFGKGLVKYKDIPATSPEGGGKVKEEVLFSLGKRDSIQAKICVTATDTAGLES